MARVVNGQAIREANTGFQVAFDEGWDKATPMYTDIVLETASDNEEEVYHIPMGAGSMREWTGPRQKHTAGREVVRLKNVEYENTLAVPRTAIADDKLGLFLADARSMGAIARLHPEELIGELLINGFVDKGYDDVAFFSASHPLLDGSTQSNLVDEALSETAFEEAEKKIMAMKNPRGRRIKVLRTGASLQLVVPPSLAATAERIVKLRTVTNGGENRNYNRASVVVLEELEASAGKWFLLAAKGPLRPLVFQTREAPLFTALDQPNDHVVFMDNEVVYGVYARHAVGYLLPQMAIGGTGG